MNRMPQQNFYKKLELEISSGKSPYVIESGEGAYLTINGVKRLNFCSSHYLGLAEDQRLKDAVCKATQKYGVGTGYRTLAGTHTLHLQLEKKIAKFKGTEATVVFTSAYMANAAAIQTILGKEDIIISDELNHASIIDAIRLSQVANKFIYKHGDVNDLEEKLKEFCPDGVDIYFDNVGGEISDAVLSLINNNARIPLCGQISSYNEIQIPTGPRIQPQLLTHCALMKGFLIRNYADNFDEGITETVKWLRIYYPSLVKK